ncbi:unnamed protein product [Trichobilharzia szidati]|nr:unnamed protein product [Trichobilharzia szidati]CAH8875127.1 unnamed protein product [Trichobilharzia szidati]
MGSSFSCTSEVNMANKLLPAAVVSPRSKHTATLIFLHGLGDTGHGWSDALRSHVPDYFKVICPHANSIPVTLNGGMQMPAWYDIYALSENARQDEAGIKEASSELGKFVDSEVKAGIPIENIVIGGFSQGGSVALYNALTGTSRYGGVVAFSCWLPLHVKFMTSPTLLTMPKDVPIFQCHGLQDCTIPFAMGKLTHELLQTFQLSKCELKSYPHLSHSSCEQEMEDLRAFLVKNIPGTQK